MAWTTPRTWIAGEKATAAMLNTHLRDNLAFLYAAKAARVYNSAAQSLANNTLTAITWDTESLDTDAIHSTASNTSRLVVPAGLAGIWAISGQLEFAANATGVREIDVRKNGSTVIAFAKRDADASVATVVPVTLIVQLAAADYVELLGWQNSGAALNTDAGASVSFFEARWMGA